MPGARLYILVPLLLIIVGGATTGFFRASGQDRQEGFWASWEYTGRPSLTMITEFRSRIGASEWPPFTLVYELEQGQSVMVGNRQIDSRQVRRYEYVSPTEWKDTDPGVGTHRHQGRHLQQRGFLPDGGRQTLHRVRCGDQLIQERHSGPGNEKSPHWHPHSLPYAGI